MKEIIKKIIAILLVLGFSITSIPVSAEPIEDMEVPLAVYTEEVSSEPEGGDIYYEEGGTESLDSLAANVVTDGKVLNEAGLEFVSSESESPNTTTAAETTAETTTPVQETVVPSTEAPATESNTTLPPVAVETPATETTAQPTETESPSEEEYLSEIENTEGTGPIEEEYSEEASKNIEEATEATKTEFVYEDDEIHAIVTLNEADALPADSLFFITEVFENSLKEEDRELFQWSDEQLNGYLQNKLQMYTVNSFYYDMFFEVDGARVMPANEFKIEITYKNNEKILDKDANKDNVRIGYFNDNDITKEIELIDTNAKLEVNELGAVTKAEFVIGRYQYPPVMIYMLENQEAHDARLAAEAEANAAVPTETEQEVTDDLATVDENAGEDADSERKIIYMETVTTEPAESVNNDETEKADEDASAKTETEEEVEKIEESTEEESKEETAEEDKEKTEESEEGEETEETEETEPVEAEPTVRLYPIANQASSGNVYATAVLSDAAQVPDDAKLWITPVTPDSSDYNYDAYMNALNEQSAGTTQYTPENTLLYDIAFMVPVKDENGEPTGEMVEYEPAPGTVSVRLSFRSGQLSNEINAEAAENVKVNHLVADVTADNATIDASEISVESMDANVSLGYTDSVSFNTESFSVFAISYTVDFHYDDEEVSIEGATQVLLSTLITQLGIKDENGEFIEVANVASVSFSDERLVTVEQVSGEVEVNGKTVNVGEKDFLLTSKEPFTSNEQLILIMSRGEQIKVDVTDAMQTTSPWNLANPDNVNWVHVKVDSSVTETEQSRNASFDLTVSYEFKEDTVKAMDAYNDVFTVVYDLNDTLRNAPVTVQNFTNGKIMLGSRKIGDYSIVDGVATLSFTDPSFFNGKTQFSGYFSVTVKTDETKLGTSDEYTYQFPGTTDTIPIHYKKSVENGSKSVNAVKDSDGNWVLHYTANINVNTNLDTLKFIDTIGGLQTLDTSSVKIGGRPVTVQTTTNGFTFDVQTALGTTGVAKGSYQVTYDTKLTDAQLRAMTAQKTTETNKVTWKVNGDKEVPGGETSKEFEKPREPIPVVKTISKTSSAPGDTVNYTITFGKETTELSGFHISDYMTDVVIPQGKVTLTYNGQNTKIDFGAQSKDSSYSKGWVNLFDYTFPEGTPGYGPVTATYSVKLIDADTAEQNGIYDATDVTNTAQEHRQNTTDTKKTTVTYNKEPHYEVKKTATGYSTNADGKIEPGSEITYTLSVGDSNTNMAGVWIKDVMNDLQVLQGDIKIKVGNGAEQSLATYAPESIKWSDDGKYSSNYVTLFEFNMPSDAGNGPVVITYKTRVIDQGTANAANIYGNLDIKNTGYGGNEHQGTNIPGFFGDYPIGKTVTEGGVNVNGTTRSMEDTVHYTLTLGQASMNLAGAVIEDYITDLQKLVSDIKITRANGSSFNMPGATSPYAEDGNRWSWINDGRYSKNDVCLFKYKLPNDIGNGPITIEYDCQIISENEAKEYGINDTVPVKNTFNHNGRSASTYVNIEFPRTVTHNPQVRKEFDHWDVPNQKVYWNIIVEKDADSAYPLENVIVKEDLTRNGIYYKSPTQNVYWKIINDASLFDVINAVVTTDDGTVLTPGVDYTVDQNTTEFKFATLTERVHINLAFNSPHKIIDGYLMHNIVELNNGKTGEAEEEYKNPKIDVIKNGNYTENDKRIEWVILINPSKKAYTDSDPVRVMFSDKIPKGLKLVGSKIHVKYTGKTDGYSRDITVTVDPETNEITPVDIAGHNVYGQYEVGLDGETLTVSYYTELSDEVWDEITSSATGSETFENKATITAGYGDEFDASDKVTVTTEGYITKTDSTVEQGGIVVDPEMPSSHSKNITYTVEINPNGYVLNHGNTLELTDYIDTNMDLDPLTVKLVNATKNASTGKLEANDPETTPAGISISYNDDVRLMAIRGIPDQTPLLLTYTCLARAQGQDTFKNTATLIGGGSHSATDTEVHRIQTNDAGVKLDGLLFNLLKVDENNISKKLSGAHFQLYRCDLAIGDMTDSATYDTAYWNGLLDKMNKINAGNGTQAEIDEIKQTFKITGYVPIDSEKITDENGYVYWESLNEHRLYAWKETKSPENYTSNGDYHYFVLYQHIDTSSESFPQPLLSEDEQTRRKNAAWALDDACQLANGIRVASIANLVTWTATNVESRYTSISATKVWENDSNNLFKTRPTGGIKLQLYRINADNTRTPVGAPVVINADSSGNWPTYIWNKLEAVDGNGNDYKYTVVETNVPNYTTRYSDGGAGVTSGPITVTNRMIPKTTDIHVMKRFDPDDNDKPNEIKVKLYVIETDEEGVSSNPMYTGKQAELSDINDWKHTFDKLETVRADVNTGKVYKLTYTVLEDVQALEAKGFHYIVTYSDNGNGVMENTEEDPLLITNKKIRYGNLKVTKELIGDVTGNEDKIFKVTVKNSRGEYLQYDKTTFGSLPYEFNVSPSSPLTVESLVVDVYTVEEKTGTGYVDIIDGYTWDESGSTTTGTATLVEDTTTTVALKNKYDAGNGSLKLKKNVEVNGAGMTNSTSASIKAMTNGVYTFNITGTGASSIYHTVTIEYENGSVKVAKLDGTTVLTADTNGFYEVSDLPEGNYTIEEVTPTNGMKLSKIGDTAAGNSTSTTVTVESGKTGESVVAKAEFTNNLELTKISAKKTWGGADDWPANMSVTFEIQQFANGQKVTSFQTTQQVNGYATSATINSQQTVEWINLPKEYWDQTSSTYRTYTYKVVETAVKYNGNPLATNYRTVYTVKENEANQDGLVIIDNTPVTVDIEVNKEWAIGLDKRWPSDVDQVVVQLQKSVNGGTAVDVTGKTATITRDNWQLTETGVNSMDDGEEKTAALEKLEMRFFRNLPKYDEAGNLITYSVVENSQITGFTVAYNPASVTEGGKIVVKNSKDVKPIKLTVKKVWKLVGADGLERDMTGEQISYTVWRKAYTDPKFQKLYNTTGDPEKVTLTQADNGFTGTLGTSNNWKETVTNLPAQGEGSDKTVVYYKYYVKEAAGANYPAIELENANGTDAYEFVLTNKLTEAKVTKKWKMGNDEASLAWPQINGQYPKVTFTLSRSVSAGSSEAVQTVVVSTDGTNFTLTDEEGQSIADSVATFRDGVLTFRNLAYTSNDNATYTYSIAETKAELGEQDVTALFKQDTATAGTIINQYTDFNVKKIWKNGSGAEEAWPEGKSITLKLVRGTRMDNGALAGQDNDFGLDIILTKSSGAITGTVATTDGKTAPSYLSKIKVTVTSEGTVNNIHVEPLEAGWVYQVTEESLEGYSTAYYGADGADGAVKLDHQIAFEGEKIVNSLVTFSMPATGGIGTTLFTILGGLLIAGGGAALLIRGQRRRKRKEN